MKLKPVTLAILSYSTTLFIPAIAAAETQTHLNTVLIQSTSIPTTEFFAANSVRIYEREEIKASQANTLFDFLKDNTTLQVQTNYGNPLMPLISFGGYGLETGYENIKFIIDGFSINSIDLNAPLLSSIPLDSIESIEIVKGSGSVQYGNGATAGAIVINTNQGFTPKEVAKIFAGYGSNQTKEASIQLSKTDKTEDALYGVDFNHQILKKEDGKTIASDGTKDTLENRTTRVGVNIKTEKVTSQFNLGTSSSEVNYPGAMTLSEYKNSVNELPTGPMAINKLDTTNFNAAIAYHLSEQQQLKFSLSHHIKDSYFELPVYSYTTETDYITDVKKLEWLANYDDFSVNIGAEKTRLQRSRATDKTDKDALAYFLSTRYQFGNNLSVNAGFRTETTDYAYNSSSTSLKDDEDNQAYELGLGYTLDNHSMIYANVNKGYLTPNVDRFFNYDFFVFDYVFNDFIETMTNVTTTTGYKYFDHNIKAKAEIFVSQIEDEIYYNPSTYQNTNYEKSLKQGVNLGLNFKLSSYDMGVDYAYVDATNQSDNFQGKIMPGVSEHSLSAYVGKKFQSNLIANLTNHAFRISHKATSDSYALSDINNEYGRLPGINTTNLNYSISNKKLTISASVENLFEQDNALYVVGGSGLGVYPSGYERNYRLKAEYSF